MLEVIFTNDKPASSMVKVVAMHEDKPIKADFLSSEEAKLVQRAIKQANFNGKAKQSLDVYGGKTKIVLI